MFVAVEETFVKSLALSTIPNNLKDLLVYFPQIMKAIPDIIGL